MQTLHIHGWRRFGTGRRKLFTCCTSPSCYEVRSWSDIIWRYATCTKCFQRFIVLGYQVNNNELKCHPCNHRKLTETEEALLSRLEVEASKNELIKLILCNQRIVIEEKKPIPIEEIQIEELPSVIVIPKEVVKSIEFIGTAEDKKVPTEVPVENALEFMDVQVAPKQTDISPEDEERLKVVLEKKLRKMLEEK